LDWATNWSQSAPACLLYGPTASGKSRTVEWLALRLHLHVIEIDCASVSGVREVVSTADEATRSHSVGLFLPPELSERPMSASIVVLEHCDALIPRSSAVPPSLMTLFSTARVPTVMTANVCCLPPAPWLRMVRFEKPARPFDIVASALWMKASANSISVRQQIHGILDVTENDIRRTALQYQVQKGRDGIMSREEELFLSIPTLVRERDWNPEVYSSLCDCILATDCNSQFFDAYMRPPVPRVFAPEREEAMAARYEFVRDAIPMSHCNHDERLDAVEIGVVASRNLVPITRHRSGPSLSGRHSLTQGQIAEMASWNLWPRIDVDVAPAENNELAALGAPVEAEGSTVDGGETPATGAVLPPGEPEEPPRVRPRRPRTPKSK
jgi:hypothetical protein